MRWRSFDEYFSLPLSGETRLKGTHRKVDNEASSAPLVVFSHGLAANQNDLKFYYGSRVLAEQGIESIRFDYYGYDDQTRKLRDCTREKHVADLGLVVQFVRNKFPDRQVVLVGHSLGGLVALSSEERNFDGLVLWDASHSDCWPGEIGNPDDATLYEPSLEEYRLRWAFDLLVPDMFVESFRNLPCDGFAKSYQRPLLVVAAGDNVLVPFQKRYFEAATEPREYVEIAWAVHTQLPHTSIRHL